MSTVKISPQLVKCAKTDCQSRHPNIKAYRSEITLILDAKPIGEIKAFVLDKATMDSTGPNRMWDECDDFDNSHVFGNLYKIENFLSNESFPPSRRRAIQEAEGIVFIDQVRLEGEFRGRGLGLEAVRKMIEALALGTMTVAMLQAGTMDDCGSGDASDAAERLARHWGRLGFRPWSESDESWLLLSMADRDHEMVPGAVIC